MWENAVSTLSSGRRPLHVPNVFMRQNYRYRIPQLPTLCLAYLVSPVNAAMRNEASTYPMAL